MVHHRTSPRSVATISGPAHARAQYALRNALERATPTTLRFKIAGPRFLSITACLCTRSVDTKYRGAFTPNDRSNDRVKNVTKCAPPFNVSGCTRRRHNFGRRRISDASETSSAASNDASCFLSRKLFFAPGWPYSAAAAFFTTVRVSNAVVAFAKAPAKT